MMKLAHCRKLLQDDAAFRTTRSPAVTYFPEPPLQPMNSSSTAVMKRGFRPNTPFDSSMALTILILLTVLFFMAFISVYIRRLSEPPTVLRRRRYRNAVGSPPTISSSSSRSLSNKGLDPSTVGSLPLVPYGGDTKHQIDCAICLTEFEQRETVKMIPYCRHVFHPGCVDTWLSSHVSCPLCRSTRMRAVDEVRLGVVQEDGDRGVS